MNYSDIKLISSYLTIFYGNCQVMSHKAIYNNYNTYIIPASGIRKIE